VEACPQCGLVFANAQPAEFYPSEEVAEQWRELLAHWGDPKKHEQFLKSMTALGELVAAGRLYRLRLAIAPSDVIAQRGRDEVVRLATIGSPLFNKEPAEVQRAVRWQHVALGMFILLCITVAVVLFRQVAQRLP
jgi:rRNA maturation protein Nop10